MPLLLLRLGPEEGARRVLARSNVAASLEMALLLKVQVVSVVRAAPLLPMFSMAAVPGKFAPELSLTVQLVRPRRAVPRIDAFVINPTAFSRCSRGSVRAEVELLRVRVAEPLVEPG